MIDEKYRRKKLFKVGQVVKIRRDLSIYYDVIGANKDNLEKLFQSYNNGSDYFESRFMGISDEMASVAGCVSIVKLLVTSNDGFDCVILENDKK